MYSDDIRFSVLARLAAFALSALPCFAIADQHIVCPASVDPRKVQVEAPRGWIGGFGRGSTLPLLGVQAVFVTGSLRDDDAWGEMKDPPTMRKGDAVITRYPLPPDFDKYLICDYGRSVYQAMKLPSTTKECAVVSRPLAGANRKVVDYTVSDIICK